MKISLINRKHILNVRVIGHGIAHGIEVAILEFLPHILLIYINLNVFNLTFIINISHTFIYIKNEYKAGNLLKFEEFFINLLTICFRYTLLPYFLKR
jgi:hypothetical protein